MISKWGLSVLGVLSLMLGACVELSGEQQVASRTEQAQDWMKRLSEKAASADLIQNDAPRVTGEEVKLRVAALPQALLARMSYHTEGNQSFLQVLDSLSTLLSMPLSANDLGVTPLLANSALSASSGPTARALTGLPTGVQVASSPGLGWEALASTPITLNYQGTVKGLLDELARKINGAWRFNALTQGVEFFCYDTRVLSLSLPPGVKRISAAISLSGVSGGAAASGALSSSAGNVAVSQSLSVNPWASIMQGIQSLLSEGASGAPSTGGANAAVALSGAATAAASGVSGTSGTSGTSGAGGAGGMALNAASSNGLAIANPELGRHRQARPLGTHCALHRCHQRAVCPQCAH